MSKRFVCYFRVSTSKQGENGHGMEAQKTATAAYLAQHGGECVCDFVEVESGKRVHNRPQLAAALALCRKKKATLLIAKLDRLTRNVAFLAAVLESGVELVACDYPSANRMMLQMLAVFAEEEGRQISKRTKDALAAAKARGVRLGAPDPSAASTAGVAALQQQADAFAANVVPVIRSIQASGLTSLNQVAVALNARGIRTARGGEWTATAVKRVLARVG